jgi:hypothetical protein
MPGYCYSGRLLFFPCGEFLQPVAFRHCLLRQCFHAVHSFPQSGTSRTERHSGMRCGSRMYCNLQVYRGPKPFSSCSLVTHSQKNVSGFCDLPNFPDQSMTGPSVSGSGFLTCRPEMSAMTVIAAMLLFIWSVHH